jgi:hypothetical protein
MTYTGTQLSNSDGSNRTATSLSVHILIMNDKNQAVGALKTFSVDENNDIGSFTEIGTDAIVDSFRKSPTKISGTCDHVRWDKKRVTQVFGRNFIHAQSQVAPFDIKIIDRQSKDPANWVTTVIKNVWIKSLSYAYSADDWMITDKMSWQAETIYSTLGDGHSPVAQGGAQINLSDDTTNPLNAEQAADTGFNGRRGAMDIPGLIDAIVI